MIDLQECSAYKKTGEIPPSLVGLGPMELQKQFNFNNERLPQDEIQNTRPRRTRQRNLIRQL